MNRRGYLRSSAVIGGIALAGCLSRLGFEEESAWRDPPLVDDRPDAVYVPASTEEMGTYGTATDGEYAVALTYTFPHRFWNVSGSVSNPDRKRVTVGTDDTLHLMCTVWDPETELVLPVDVHLEVLRDGQTVADVTPWPMLSQRMGFHYGDNVILPDDGEYLARVTVGPVQGRRTGAFEGRFDAASTLEIPFEYDRSDVHDLSFDPVDEDRRGERGALELMAHGDHGGTDGDGDHDEDDGDHGEGEDDHDDGEDDHDGQGSATHPPSSRGPPIEALPGRHLGTERTGDAALSAILTDADRFAGADAGADDETDADDESGTDEESGADDETGTDDESGTDDGSDAAGSAEEYLAVFLRTPYNDVVVPMATLSATIDRGDERIEETLAETVDHEFGHHYGLPVESIDDGTEVTVAVETVPSVARHDGYETAFLEFGPVTFVP